MYSTYNYLIELSLFHSLHLHHTIMSMSSSLCDSDYRYFVFHTIKLRQIGQGCQTLPYLPFKIFTLPYLIAKNLVFVSKEIGCRLVESIISFVWKWRRRDHTVIPIY